jgi:geranylgeranyl pyrophosphate synthase
MSHPSLLKHTPPQDVPQAFTRYRSDLEQTLKEIVGGDHGLLYRMLRYHLGWEDEHGSQTAPSGKAVRSTFCLLAAHALSGDYRQALPAAAALELVHNFSLIHDDIQDGSPGRRHRPTVWTVWGAPQAINAGDAMYTLARLALLRLDSGLASNKVLTAARLLDDGCLRMIEGQCLDLQYQSLETVTGEQYLDMIGKKTGALLSCSLEMGALLASDDVETRRRFRDAGFHLGLAFQMRDDLLGIWGDAAVTGKPAGEDIQSKNACCGRMPSRQSPRGASRRCWPPLRRWGRASTCRRWWSGTPHRRSTPSGPHSLPVPLRSFVRPRRSSRRGSARQV